MPDTMRVLTNDYKGLTHAITAAASEVAAKPAELRAVIELGTHSVKLLVAEFSRSSVRTIHKARVETGLEDDFFGSRRLQPKRIEHVAQVAGAFASEALQLRACAIRVIATSAARHALNQADLLAAVEAAVGLKVEVISGEQEAEWVFDGVSRDPNLLGLPLMVLDLGGGSTEFAFGQGGLIHSRHSFPLGSMRLLERLALPIPPTLGDLDQCRDLIAGFLDRESGATLESGLKKFSGQRVWLVGAGAKFNVLSRLAAEFAGPRGPQTAVTQAGFSTSLSLDPLQGVIEWLWRSTRAERQLHPAITPRRVDCILTEAVMVEAIMQRFDFHDLYISSWGLRHGALLAACAGSDSASALNGQANPGSGTENPTRPQGMELTAETREFCASGACLGAAI